MAQRLSPLLDKRPPRRPRKTGPRGRQRPLWGSLLLFDLLLVALLVLASRTATLLHEVLGHACPVLLLGGEVRAIRVTLFGGGKVYHHFDGEPTLWAGLLVAFGGIAVNLVSGTLALGWAGRTRRRPLAALFLALFATISILGSVAYSALGFYYGQGDPVAWMKEGPPRESGLWLPFVLASPLLSYLTLRCFARLIQGWFPAATFAGRGVLLLLTLGVSGGGYAGLYEVTGRESVALEAPETAHRRAVKQAQEAKRRALVGELTEQHPEWTETRLLSELAQRPVVVRPEEVPRRFPLKALIAFLYALGGLGAVLHDPGHGAGERQGALRADRMAWILLAAVSVVGVLAASGGWLLPPPPGPK